MNIPRYPLRLAATALCISTITAGCMDSQPNTQISIPSSISSNTTAVQAVDDNPTTPVDIQAEAQPTAAMTLEERVQASLALSLRSQTITSTFSSLPNMMADSSRHAHEVERQTIRFPSLFVSPFKQASLDNQIRKIADEVLANSSQSRWFDSFFSNDVVYEFKRHMQAEAFNQDVDLDDFAVIATESFEPLLTDQEFLAPFVSKLNQRANRDDVTEDLVTALFEEALGSQEYNLTSVLDIPLGPSGTTLSFPVGFTISPYHGEPITPYALQRGFQQVPFAPRFGLSIVLGAGVGLPVANASLEVQPLKIASTPVPLVDLPEEEFTFWGLFEAASKFILSGFSFEELAGDTRVGIGFMDTRLSTEIKLNAFEALDIASASIGLTIPTLAVAKRYGDRDFETIADEVLFDYTVKLAGTEVFGDEISQMQFDNRSSDSVTVSGRLLLRPTPTGNGLFNAIVDLDNASQYSLDDAIDFRGLVLSAERAKANW